MLKIYGTLRCPDCVECCTELDKTGTEYEFLDFDKDLRLLKDFLKLRDTQECFAEAKKEGYIGIPCIVREDGTVTLNWK